MAIVIVCGVLGLLVLVLILIKSGNFLISIEHVPDGVEWRAHYRKMRSKRTRRAGPATWLLIGLGIALLIGGAAMALLLS